MLACAVTNKLRGRARYIGRIMPSRHHVSNAVDEKQSLFEATYSDLAYRIEIWESPPRCIGLVVVSHRLNNHLRHVTYFNIILEMR